MSFRGLDRNNDGQISRAEWRGNDTSFANQDWNGDGVLSGNEVREDGRRDGHDGKNERHGKNERYGNNDSNSRFTALDRNNNGSIGSSEWNSDRASFNRLDTNRNGNLSRDEFARWDDRYGNNNSNTRFAALDRNNNGVIGSAEWNGDRATFDRLDTSRNGNLSRDEFARWDDRYGNNNSNTRFAALDRNNNGVIGSAEWNGDRATFDRLDTSRNGNLSRDEFARWDERYGNNNSNTRFAALDRNNNGVIGSAEWNGDRATFDRLDTSRNGNLSRDEFARWDDRYGNNGYGNNDSNARFAALDRNNNGVIGSAEWNGDRATFDRLDTSRNGNLSRDEFARWDERYGNNDSNSRFAALDRNNNGVIGSTEWDGDRASFDRLDTNRNGNLSRDEFTRGSGLSWVN